MGAHIVRTGADEDVPGVEVAVARHGLAAGGPHQDVPLPSHAHVLTIGCPDPAPDVQGRGVGEALVRAARDLTA